MVGDDNGGERTGDKLGRSFAISSYGNTKAIGVYWQLWIFF